jgi:hypothetical protein
MAYPLIGMVLAPVPPGQLPGVAKCVSVMVYCVPVGFVVKCTGLGFVPVPDESSSSWQVVHMTNWPETVTEPLSVVSVVFDRSDIGPEP